MEKTNFEDGDFFVTEPKTSKDGVTSFTSYTVKGKKVPEPVVRRYREFDCLRSKLVERWPGIFIPELPHKKTVGKNDKEVVDLTVEQINRFCAKLANLPHIFNSTETQMFLQNTSDVLKTMNSLPSESYSDMVAKYRQAFPEFDEVILFTFNFTFHSHSMLNPLKEILTNLQISLKQLFQKQMIYEV